MPQPYTCCLPQCLSRKLDWKRSHQDLNSLQQSPIPSRPLLVPRFVNAMEVTLLQHLRIKKKVYLCSVICFSPQILNILCDQLNPQQQDLWPWSTECATCWVVSSHRKVLSQKGWQCGTSRAQFLAGSQGESSPRLSLTSEWL